MSTSIVQNSNDSHKQLNIETRIADRARSIFAAFGQVINDFYLEAGIYFVGGFNAALVAWDIYTDLLSNSQPLPYAIAIAFIAFIAVEGLAVYLVGAAAKTNNGLLWFFSIIFAGFFTYAHYQETANSGVISQYITLAIPFFVVVGYWARTVKAETESNQEIKTRQQEVELARQQRLEDEERKRQQEIEAQKLAHKLEMQRIKEANKQAQKLAQIEAQKVQKEGHLLEMNRSNEPLNRANETRQNKKMNRQNAIIEIVNINPDIGPTELTRQLNELGHDTSVSTVKRDIKVLNGRVS